MAPRSSTAEIDPRSDATVLFYQGPGVVPDVPARDLHGGDLARIAYVRAHRATEWERRDEDGNPPPRPRPATQAQLQRLADELLESGAYRKTEPSDAAEPRDPNEQPAAPAEG